MSERIDRSTIASPRERAEWRRGALGALALLLGALLASFAGTAQGAALTLGQVLVGQDTFNDTGKVRQFSSSGSLVGVLQTPALGGQETGMCFDAAGNLYTTNFFAFSISKFSPGGALLSASFIDVSPRTPNSCVFDAAGHLYVGLSDANGVTSPGGGEGGLLKYQLSPTPTLVAVYRPGRDESPDFSGRGTDWIDLAGDQCTMLYTSIGNSIRRFNVCANAQTPPALSGAQLTDYCGRAPSPPCDDGAGGPTGPFYALRILLNGGGVLVADNQGYYTGGVVRQYTGNVATGTGVHARNYAGENLFGTFCGASGEEPCLFPFALNLDPDGTSFWTADNATSEVFRFVIDGPDTPMQPVFCGAEACDFTHFVTGLAVVGELTAATANPATAASASVTPNGASKTYGAPDPVLTGTLVGFLPADGVTATYSRTGGETVAGSPYTISAVLSPAGVLGSYAITYNTAAFTITQAEPTVVATGNTCGYSGGPCAGSGTATGVLNESLTPVTLTYRDAQNTVLAGAPVAAGTYTMVAAFAGNGNYTAKQSAPATITIGKLAASVTPNGASKVYGAADPALTGTLSGFLAADAVTASYSRAAGETVAGGPYTISGVLSPAGVLGNYDVTYNTASFTIGKTSASVTPNEGSKIYGAADPLLTGTLSGFLAGDGVTATYSRTAGENVAGSPYAISGVLSPAGALGNYTISYNTAGFTITPATPVITWADPAAITYPTPLGATQLNATANAAGSLVYTPAAGTVLNAGNGQLLSVLLTPDSSNYTTASADVHINVLAADASVNLSTTTPVITAGDAAVYNLVVTSNGQGSAGNVVLTDTLPAGLAWTVSGPDAAACAPGSPVAGGTALSCSFGTLLSGATRAVTLTATASAADCNGISNTATVSATGDTDAGNNSSGPVTIAVYCPALAVSKSTPSPTISAGDQAKYDVTVTAGGTGSSTNVVMKDTLPAGFNWTVSGTDASACSPGSPVAGGTTLTCSFGTMASGMTKKITVAAATTAASCGVISNTAVVTATGDTTADDNSAGPVPITVYCPDVSVVTSTSTPAINSGGTASYSVVVKGNGPGTANNVVLSDTVPAGLDWTVGGPDSGDCLPSSPVTGGMTLTCNFGSLASGETRTITLSAVTTAANCGVIKNTATVTAAGDTNAGNNSSGPVAITVSCAPVSVTLSCPNVTLAGAAFAVSGMIAPPSASGVTVQYTSPSGVGTSHVTQSSPAGSYTDSFTPNEYGPWTVSASWNGAQSPACPVLVYGKSEGGSFVIGDGDAVVGHAADFWGSQWWMDNTWSGGVNPGVASLKGYLDAVDLPGNCGGSWSTRPGNSSKPPASIPPYMAVIVSSSISKNGSTIAGDVVAEVIVRTNGGYGPNPGHDGNGTIVAVRCHK
jgi:uncharacterized repeat protein (TIGR01451 family)